MKQFFNISESKYQFNIFDVTALLTVLNVIGLICGIYYAPIVGIVNCIINIVFTIKNHGYVNNYTTQIALLVLNFFFLF